MFILLFSFLDSISKMIVSCVVNHQVSIPRHTVKFVKYRPKVQIVVVVNQLSIGCWQPAVLVKYIPQARR